MSDARGLRIRLLGNLAASYDGATVDLGGPRRLPAPSCGRPRRKRQPDRSHRAQAGPGRLVGARFASDAPRDADCSSD